MVGGSGMEGRERERLKFCVCSYQIYFKNLFSVQLSPDECPWTLMIRLNQSGNGMRTVWCHVTIINLSFWCWLVQWFRQLYCEIALHWRHNDHDSVSSHQPHGCLLNRLFRRRSKKTSKLRVTGLCVGNSPGPVNSPHKGPVTRKMFPFDDVIMIFVNNNNEKG